MFRISLLPAQSVFNQVNPKYQPENNKIFQIYPTNIKKTKNFTETGYQLEFFKKLRINMIELAVAIGIINLVAAMLLRAWCNKKTEDMINKWKK